MRAFLHFVDGLQFSLRRIRLFGSNRLNQCHCFCSCSCPVIKTLIVIPTLDQSGAEKQFGMLACQLPRADFDVRVIAVTRGGPYEQWLNDAEIPYSILRKRWRLDPSVLIKLRKDIQAHKPDVVLSCLFSANTSVRLATIGLPNPPVTIISERCVDSWKSGWQLWMDRCLQKRTDRLVANSQSVADFYSGNGFPAERISVIPNGVDVPPQPAVSRATLLQELGLPPDAKLIMYVGRLAPQKRVRDLIWATQILRQSDPRAYFLIAGEGPQRTELEIFARETEAFPHVRFLGHRADASSLLHLADLFWLASEFEGMSNSLMEAMACGKPVIVSDIPPNRELVEHERSGYVVNLGDSVGFSQYTERLIQDDELSRRLGEAARDRMVSEFSTRMMVRRYSELILDEVQRHRHSTGSRIGSR